MQSNKYMLIKRILKHAGNIIAPPFQENDLELWLVRNTLWIFESESMDLGISCLLFQIPPGDSVAILSLGGSAVWQNFGKSSPHPGTPP